MKSVPVVTISRSPFSRMAVEATRSARAVGLRYVLDSTPGIERRRQGKSVRYVRPNGMIIRDPGSLRRIASLVIPPAWTNIWICTDPHGHLQATGRDAKGRKQYRYHERWNDVRNEGKYDRMLTFGRLLPKIRKRVIECLRLPGLPRDKILAAVVRLLETTLIRVGNEEYARVNDSFGLTTLRDRHVQVKGSRVRFEFRGKSGILHNVDVTDRRLARIVKRSQDLPGYELFQYVDQEGARHSITSSDVNEYLQRIAGREVTAKDFRTWAGTLLAARALRDCGAPCSSSAQAKRNIVAAIGEVAKRLGNTRSVCRKCYVHPEVLNAYLDGTLIHAFRKRARLEPVRLRRRLPPEEAAVLRLLHERRPCSNWPNKAANSGRQA
jgi:DNA topoisomerase-1